MDQEERQNYIKDLNKLIRLGDCIYKAVAFFTYTALAYIVFAVIVFLARNPKATILTAADHSYEVIYLLRVDKLQ